MLVTFSAIIGAVLVCIVSAQAQSVTWITPPNAGASVDYTNNPVVSIGSVYDLQWTSSLDTYSIWLWQQDTGRGYTYPGNSIYTKKATDKEKGSVNWVVDLQSFTLSQSKIYFLSICHNNSLVGAFTSHYFTVTNDSTSSTTSTSSTLTPSQTSTSSVDSTPIQSATPNAIRQPSGGMTADTKIGLGVSLGLGIPLVLLAAGALWILCQRYRKPEYGPPQSQDKAEYWSADPGLVTSHSEYERQELSAQPPGQNYVLPRHELGHEASAHSPNQTHTMPRYELGSDV